MILEEKELDKNTTYGAVQTETEINGSDSPHGKQPLQ